MTDWLAMLLAWHWYRDLAKEAVSNLLQSSDRSLFAMSGIGIGSAAVVAVLHIGMAAEQKALAQFAEIGGNTLLVRSSSGGTMSEFSRLGGPAFEQFLRELDGVETAGVVIQDSTPVAVNGMTPESGLLAASPCAIHILRLRAAVGQMLPLDAAAEPLALLGSATVDPNERHGVMPDLVRIGDQGFVVNGVLEPVASNPLLDVDINHTVIVPFGAARRLDEEKQFWTALLVGKPSQDPQELAGRARQSISDKFGMAVVVSAPDALIEAEKSQRRTFSQLLTALGLVSLLAGGIGVANVMLVSVSERRTEIGLRIALGAFPQQIVGLFIGEAFLLSALGGTMGAAVGALASCAYSIAIGDAFVPSVPVCVLGASLAMGTGVIAGAYPAMLASKQDPSIVISSAA